MKEAAADLNFEEAARLRDEIQRLQRAELLAEASPQFRASFGRSARPAAARDSGEPATRARKPTDADMGPHNFGGGEARPLGRVAPPRPVGRSSGGKPGTRTVKGKGK
jgi:excinuclease ABC subunit B